MARLVYSVDGTVVVDGDGCLQVGITLDDLFRHADPPALLQQRMEATGAPVVEAT